jgi:hypothetical protein
VDDLEYVRLTAESANVMILRDIKEEKRYLEVGYQNWEDFCKQEIGCSYKTVDEAIKNINLLGAKFYDSAQQIGITSRQFKQLRGLKNEISVDDDGLSVRIGEEVIPLTPAAKDDLEEAITDLLSEKNREIDSLKKSNESKDKLREQQSEKIEKLEHENDKLKAASKPTPEESIEVLREMQNDIDVMFFRLNPEKPQLDLSSDTARAEYAALLRKLTVGAKALHDTADEQFGFGSGEWVPPIED